MSSASTRVSLLQYVNEEKMAGIKHDSNKPALEMIPLCALEECAKAFMHGERKYAAFNYTKGLETRRTLAAALRHIYQAMWESDIDSESGIMHLGHSMAAISMAIYAIKNNKKLDNRFIKLKQQKADDNN